MGNATWAGVRLKDILAKAGLHKETVVIVVNGADGPVNDKTPDFIKSIQIWRALDQNTIIALRMNGEPLPQFNGFPARLVVPGWTGTYWMKHLVTIEAATKTFLDEKRLPHPQRQIPDHRAFSVEGERCDDTDQTRWWLIL
jgi:DMSO/TMAO reductase YedYZ molybdopterin-dependent catalytic subunit